MDKNKQLLIALVIGILLLLGAVTFLLISNPSKTRTSISPTPTITVKIPVKIPTMVPGNTIMINDRRFVPNSITIKKGTLINFTNLSGARVDIESKDSTPEGKKLNIGVVDDSITTDMVSLAQGTYNYFNKLKPKETGTIIVE